MRVLCWVGSAAWLLCAAAASSHIVYGAKTLRQLVGEADLVLRARIVASGERVGLSTEKGSASRPVVEARVLEVVKGAFDTPSVRFAQHGHGVATFVPGEESLLFLLDIERSRELRALGDADVIGWVSLQEHEEGYPLRPATRETLLRAVRAYAVAGSAEPDARLAALRTATLGLLTSSDPDFAASAIRDLVLAPDLALVAKQDLPVLQSLLADPGVSMGVRAALLTELERRKLIDGERFWLHWLSDATPPPDRVRALRASGATADPGVRKRVLALLGDSDAEIASAAAAAIGGAPAAAAVEPLAEALARPEEKVRYASIRALGRIATPPALQALREAAESHPDPATRRRARAELRKQGEGALR
jgi:hypothetical protein